MENTATAETPKRTPHTVRINLYDADVRQEHGLSLDDEVFVVPYSHVLVNNLARTRFSLSSMRRSSFWARSCTATSFRRRKRNDAR